MADRRAILPAAPNVPVQIAHLAGSGGYNVVTDSALNVFADAITCGDGGTRVLYGSDAAVCPATYPKAGWATFRQLPLTEGEFRTIANNIAPYMRDR